MTEKHAHGSGGRRRDESAEVAKTNQGSDTRIIHGILLHWCVLDLLADIVIDGSASATRMTVDH